MALFNQGGGSAQISVSFSDIGISGRATVRNLWTHMDLGEFNGAYGVDVPAHGVVMLKIVASGK